MGGTSIKRNLGNQLSTYPLVVAIPNCCCHRSVDNFNYHAPDDNISNVQNIRLFPDVLVKGNRDTSEIQIIFCAEFR